MRVFVIWAIALALVAGVAVEVAADSKPSWGTTSAERRWLNKVCVTGSSGTIAYRYEDDVYYRISARKAFGWTFRSSRSGTWYNRVKYYVYATDAYNTYYIGNYYNYCGYATNPGRTGWSKYSGKSYTPGTWPPIR